ncbi:Ig-like domain-containing protein [Salinibacterium sp. PAMC 21357]|uniref:Ig-like domain-containing protein n=1 Tax=Salinibacterium sp. PAMC 21357 TaxID=1112215 RepID=UPI0002E40E23|nr:Ig-like domain-containing protein [Salinibacterium sp. PAMC 21357]
MQDTLTLAEKTAIVRVTVVPVTSTIALAPLTAFVRPGEDVTVGVLDAVQNDTGRVLIVYQANPRQPQLTASVVGQSSVRVRGTTTDGLPGPIGTVGVTVTDGAGTFAEGEIAVFLVQPARDIAPIAVPDTVTVRAGAQIDIPVLDNDVSPRGEKLAISPDLVTSATAGELAFVASGVVRYLAPTVPGNYSVTYNAYLEGAPERLAAATITITVLAPGSNRAPQPRTLVGRALAGGSTTVVVPLVGADPDGDAVSLVSVTQPAAGEGSASISAEGTSLIYRAPAAGVADGQTSFTYTLRDSEGESGRGTVRMGVLSDENADLTPLTFSTQVRAQVGSQAPLTILPLLTDSDPAGGTLSLIDLVPNAPANTENPEYARLKSLIDPATNLDKGIVSLRAGDVVGSHSYIYTVQSSKSSSTAQGLIVVSVSENVAADYPTVIDTTVTLVTRDKLKSGLSVVSDKVQWITGDAGALTLSVWGSAAEKYTAKGGSISGPLPKAGTLVPFQLTGTAPNGDDVVAYGFLRIPSFDDMRVQSRASAEPVKVNEEATKSISVSDYVQIGSDDRLEVRDDEPFAVQRTNATCTPGEGATVTYSAGREAPWSDTCTLAVRVDGQSTWTVITIPITILPKDPQAILNPISRTVAPGATEKVNLYDNVTTWEGGREGKRADLDYSTTYSGSVFTVTQAGDSVTFEAHADAVPGTRETITVGVTSFGGLSSTISLVVGIAPPDAPKGASFAHQCTVSAGPSCVITAIGIGGEYDPFAGKTGGGLTLVNVVSQSCSVATISVSGANNLLATWPGGPRPAGGDCTATFTVKDAQGRAGLGELRLDVLGYPASPSSVVTTNFGPTWVDLTVSLGEASLAHPSLSGVAIYEGGSAVAASCSSASGAYICRVNGLTHGAHRFFTARAVNSVGESLDTSAHETWSYDFPVVNAVSGAPAYDAGITSATAGAVDLTITAGPTATEFRVLVDGGVIATLATAGPVTSQRVAITGTGTRTVTVEPNSGTIAPPIPRAHDGSKSAAVTVAGSPSISAGGSISATATSITATFGTQNPNGATAPFPTVYGIAQNSNLSCTGSPTGAPTVNGASLTQGTGAFTGLENNKQFWVIACYGNGYGIASSDIKSDFTFNSPGSPGGDLEYRVASAATDNGGGAYSWNLESGPNPTAPPFFSLVWNPHPFPSSLDPDVVPNYTVKGCIFNNSRCGPESPITPEAGSAPTAIVVQFVPGRCLQAPLGVDDGINPLSFAADDAEATQKIVVSQAAKPFTDAKAKWDPMIGAWTYTASFFGAYANTAAVSFVCTP